MSVIHYRRFFGIDLSENNIHDVMALYESLLQHELSEKVIADRKEKFENPAILLGLNIDGLKIG